MYGGLCTVGDPVMRDGRKRMYKTPNYKGHVNINVFYRLFIIVAPNSDKRERSHFRCCSTFVHVVWTSN